MKHNGFTLVELLVVVSIMGILSVVLADALTQSLRGASKADILSKIQQNGRVVIDRMVKDIRASSKVVCINDNNTGTIPSISGRSKSELDTIVLKVINEDGSIVYKRYRYYAPDESGGKNGFIAYDEVSIASDDQGELHCEETAQDEDQMVILTDTNNLSGVSVNSGYDGEQRIFERFTPAEGRNDVVKVSFRIKEGVMAGAAYEVGVEEGVLFATTVELRSSD